MQTDTHANPFVLRSYQEEASAAGAAFFRETPDERRKKGNAIMVLPTGCHAKGTMILMADGSSKPVEDVGVGDLLLGPDSTTRTVLRLCRGEDALYRIDPRRGGEPFIVNGNHVLALTCTSEGVKAVCPSHRRGGEKDFITVNGYMAKSKFWKNLRKLYRARDIEFTPRPAPAVDPWALGVVLGDGCTLFGQVSVCTPDPEIISAMHDWADSYGGICRTSRKPGNPAVSLNFTKAEDRHDRTVPNLLMNALRRVGICGKGAAEKFVPDEYKFGAIHTRREVLAGLLDTDGHYDGRGGYDYISKSVILSSDVVFIARSLGVTATLSREWKQCQTGAGDYYFRVHLSGWIEQLPLRVERKKPEPRRQKKNPLVTGFSIEPVGHGEYFGFELDGDHLYLTADFFVHHNSGKSLVAASIADRLREPLLIFQPSKELVQQNAEKLMAFGHVPHVFSASCNSKEVGATGVTLATIGSAMNHPELFSHFRHMLVDEAHCINAKTGMYKEFIERMDETGVLGMTATPYRLASNSYGCCLRFLTRTRPRIFHRVIHVTQNGDLFAAGHLARLEYFSMPGFDRSQLRPNSTGNDFTDASVQQYFWKTNFNAKLADVTRRVSVKRKNVLVFTRFVEEAQYIADNVPSCAMVSAVTPPKERASIIAGFRSGAIKAVANVGVLAIGFDYPELECVVMASPTMSLAQYYQKIGRCVRPHPAKASAWVVDLCDNVKQFGHVENLFLAKDEKGLWHVESCGRQLTNVYYGKEKVANLY